MNLLVARFPLNFVSTKPDGFDKVGYFEMQKSWTIYSINSSLSAPEYSSNNCFTLVDFEKPESFPESKLFEVPAIIFLFVS